MNSAGCGLAGGAERIGPLAPNGVVEGAGVGDHALKLPPNEDVEIPGEVDSVGRCVDEGEVTDGRSQLGKSVVEDECEWMERSLVGPAISPISSSSPSTPNERWVFEPDPGIASSSFSSRFEAGGAEPARSMGGLSSTTIAGTGTTESGPDLASGGTGNLSTSISLPSALEIAAKSNPAVLGIFLTASSSSLTNDGSGL